MRKLVVILATALVVVGAWRLWSGSANPARGRELFFGRAWVDHLPESPTDTFHVFGTSRGDPFGWYAERTVWKGAWERFKYEPRGDGKLEVLLPASGKRLRLEYKAWKCDAKGFDYCLDLVGVSDGPKRYYSKRGWEREGDLDAALAAAAH